MTRDEMISEATLSLDKTGSLYAELIDEEYDFFLSEAQSRYFKKMYGGNNIYRKGYEQNQKRRDDLRAVTVERYLSPGTNGFSLGSLFTNEEATVSTDEVYAFYLNGKAKTGGCEEWNSLDIVDHDTINKIKGDPFNKPDSNNPVAVFTDEGIVVDPIPTSVKITCLRIPKNISATQNCELAEHTHKEIVQLAVSLVLENIESPRIQSHDGVNVE